MPSQAVVQPLPLTPVGERSTQVYLALGITTLANLVLELSLTRLFSVVFYSHFAFLAISIALFGLGVGGLLSYAVSTRGGSLYAKLGTLAAANAICVPGAVWFILSRPAGGLHLVTLAEIYLVSALPFVLAGMIVSLVIADAIQQVHRAYFADLAGAACGCLILIPLLDALGGPNTVLAVGAIYAVSAVIWFHLAGEARWRAAAVAASAALSILLIANFEHPVLDLRIAKGARLPAERFVAWNSFSRVGVVEDRLGLTAVIDGDAPAAIPPQDWDHLTDAGRAALTHSGRGFPYLVRPKAKALIIGAGGGDDVGRALASGSTDITAVEINPIISETIDRKVFVRENHGLFSRSEVHLFTDDGRSFLRRSPEKYQLIQATHVNSWASTAAGAFALSENNMYTSDAFRDYLLHLTDDGILAFTRWGFDPPRDSLRLLSLATVALKSVGEEQPWLNVIVVREDARPPDWNTDTILISRKPFGAGDLERARRGIEESGLRDLYLPGDAAKNPYGELLLTQDAKAYYAAYPYNISPVDDDHPFFFYGIQPRDLWDFVKRAKRVNPSVPLAMALIGVSLAAAGGMLLLPRFLLPQRRGRSPQGRRFLAYFLCLGVAYMLIQIALIQKFMLLLGPPTYALTVILFSMLVASGAGSFFSRRMVADDDDKLMWVLGGTFLLVAVLASIGTTLTTLAAGWPLAAKAGLTIMAVAPAAFLMGMPFPSGLRRIERLEPASVGLAWSLNSAAGVLGSGVAIFLAIYLGLFVTMLIGGGLYLAALVTVWATRSVA